jgi:hypothetical protein
VPGITAPGCIVSTPAGTGVLHKVNLFPGTQVIGTVPLSIPAGVSTFDGFDLYVQYVVLDGLLGASNLVTVLATRSGTPGRN